MDLSSSKINGPTVIIRENVLNNVVRRTRTTLGLTWTLKIVHSLCFRSYSNFVILYEGLRRSRSLRVVSRSLITTTLEVCVGLNG